MNPVVNTQGWRSRLEAAFENGTTRESDEGQELYHLAAHWDTCAVGENREILKKKGYRFVVRSPDWYANTRTAEMGELGIKFMGAVDDGDYDRALDLLTQIEELPTLKEL